MYVFTRRALLRCALLPAEIHSLLHLIRISSHVKWKFAIEILSFLEIDEVVGHIMCHCVSSRVCSTIFCIVGTLWLDFSFFPLCAICPCEWILIWYCGDFLFGLKLHFQVVFWIIQFIRSADPYISFRVLKCDIMNKNNGNTPDRTWFIV